MEISLRKRSATDLGSIVGIRVGILGLGVGSGMLVPSGNTVVGNGIDETSDCVGVDTIKGVTVLLGANVADGNTVSVTDCLQATSEKPMTRKTMAWNTLFILTQSL